MSLSVLTVFREGELQHRGHEEGQRAFRVVDFPAALTQPPGLGLVSHLVEAAVLSCHEDASQVCGGDGEDVGVVCGDGEERVRQQLHPTGHAVVQPYEKRKRDKDDPDKPLQVDEDINSSVTNYCVLVLHICLAYEYLPLVCTYLTTSVATYLAASGHVMNVLFY